jgi:hypothetical protein
MATWQFYGHINGYRWHNLAERCIEHPQIHWETLTHFRSDGITPTRVDVGYFVAGDPNEYGSYEAALAQAGGEGNGE